MMCMCDCLPWLSLCDCHSGYHSMVCVCVCVIVTAITVIVWLS